MIRALIHLRFCSLRNRLRVRLRRLKEPKYLVGGIVGLLYFYGFIFRGAIGRGGRFGGGSGGIPEEFRSLAETIGAVLLLALMLAFWVIPSRRGALEFSEAEIQFLFPAPVTRRGLVHYKLMSWQLGLLFTSLVVSFFSGRLFGNGAWMSVIGWWVTLLLVQLHSLGASFGRAWLLGRGVSAWRPRLLVGGGMLVLLVVTGRWALHQLPPVPALDEWDPATLRDWAVAFSQTAPLAWLLAPLRLVVRLALTRDPMEFLRALAPALGLIGGHYLWVLRANVAFEETAVGDARAAAERVAAARGGPAAVRARTRGRRRLAPFALPPRGPVWMALMWKNLIAAGAVFRTRILIQLVAMLVPVLLVGSRFAANAPWGGIVAGMAAAIFGLSIVVGPGAMRLDLRHELPTATDLLKALPLTGRQIALGELLAPWAILAALQVFLALLGVSFLPTEWLGEGGVGTVRRLGLFVAGLLLAPALSLLGLGLQNLTVLTFPAWVLPAPGQARGGFELVGQQIIVFVGQFVALLLTLIPPAVAGGAVFAAIAWKFGPWVAAVPGALAAGGVALAEGGALVVLLGWFWDRTDLSREQSP